MVKFLTGLTHLHLTISLNKDQQTMKSTIICLSLLSIFAIPGAAAATEMPELAKASGCTNCHAIDKKVIGPAWMDVSKFYNGKLAKTPTGKDVKEATGGQPVEQFLIQKVSKGGHGNWSNAPMIANDNVFNQPSEAKQASIKQLVEFVLALSK